jgi:hypothetical protein
MGMYSTTVLDNMPGQLYEAAPGEMRCEDNRWGSDKVVMKRLIMNLDWGMVNAL